MNSVVRMNSTVRMNNTVCMNSTIRIKKVIVFPAVDMYVQFQLAISCLQEFGLIFYSSIFINIKSFLQYHVYSSIFINIMSFHQYHVYSSISCIFNKIKIYWGWVWKEMNLPLLISGIGLPIRSFSPNSQRPLYLFPSFLPLSLFLLSLSPSLSPSLSLSFFSSLRAQKREGGEAFIGGGRWGQVERRKEKGKNK